MRILMLVMALLVSSSLTAGTYYCHSAQYDADTRFDGEIGIAGADGLLTYFGPNPWEAAVDGAYSFDSPTRFRMFFEGEPAHVCDNFGQGKWNCRMGAWFRYRITCDF